MLSLSSHVTLFLHLLLSFQGCSWNAWYQRAGKHPPAGPAPGPGHPVRAGCAERHTEVRGASGWEHFREMYLNICFILWHFTESFVIVESMWCSSIIKEPHPRTFSSFKPGYTQVFFTSFYVQLSSSLGAVLFFFLLIFLK